MNGQRGLRRSAWWAIVLVVLAGCGPRTIDDLTSAEELAGMLEQAGASVEEAAATAPLAFGAEEAQPLRVNGVEVYIYRYASLEDAQAMSEKLGAGGEAVPWEGRVSVWRAGRLLVIYPGTDGGLLLLLNGLMGDSLRASPEGPEEPYPPAVAAAIAVWAEAQGVDPAGVEVLRYLPAEWANSCLGLPAEGESCAPGAVSGWVVELRAGEMPGAVHTDDFGAQVRLAPPG